MAKIPDNVMQQFRPGGATRVLRMYLKLSRKKLIGEHWLWCALERVANGEPERQVMADYMYLYHGPNPKAPSNAGHKPPGEARSA